MMKLSCKEMGVACDFVAEGRTSDEIKAKMMDHAMTEHKEMMDKMSKEEKNEMMKKMDGMLKKKM